MPKKTEKKAHCHCMYISLCLVISFMALVAMLAIFLFVPMCTSVKEDLILGIVGGFDPAPQIESMKPSFFDLQASNVSYYGVSAGTIGIKQTLYGLYAWLSGSEYQFTEVKLENICYSPTPKNASGTSNNKTKTHSFTAPCFSGLPRILARNVNLTYHCEGGPVIALTGAIATNGNRLEFSGKLFSVDSPKFEIALDYVAVGCDHQFVIVVHDADALPSMLADILVNAQLRCTTQSRANESVTECVYFDAEQRAVATATASLTEEGDLFGLLVVNESESVACRMVVDRDHTGRWKFCGDVPLAGEAVMFSYGPAEGDDFTCFGTAVAPDLCICTDPRPTVYSLAENSFSATNNMTVVEAEWDRGGNGALVIKHGLTITRCKWEFPDDVECVSLQREADTFSISVKMENSSVKAHAEGNGDLTTPLAGTQFALPFRVMADGAVMDMDVELTGISSGFPVTGYFDRVSVLTSEEDGLSAFSVENGFVFGKKSPLGISGLARKASVNAAEVLSNISFAMDVGSNNELIAYLDGEAELLKTRKEIGLTIRVA